MTTPHDPYQSGYGQRDPNAYDGRPPHPQQQWGQPQPGAQPSPYPQPGSYGQPGGYPPPPKKSNTGKTIGIIAAVLAGVCVVGGVIGVVNSGGETGTGTSPAAAVGHEVTFEATAENGTITMVNWSIVEDSAVENNPASPRKKTVTLEDQYGLVGINVSGTGTVTCRLLVDEGSSASVVNCSDTVSP